VPSIGIKQEWYTDAINGARYSGKKTWVVFSLEGGEKKGKKKVPTQLPQKNGGKESQVFGDPQWHKDH